MHRRTEAEHRRRERFHPIPAWVTEANSRLVKLLPEAAGNSCGVFDAINTSRSPQQVAAKLRAFGDAGLRHVVLAPVAGLVSQRAALYGLWATGQIARSLSQMVQPH